MKPLVSVVMPVYNAEKYIRKAIESILNQTYINFELIIIDDCPTDSSMDIVNSFNDNRIKIIHNASNSGIAYSRNIGLDNCQGEYIALMDDDDISTPQRFELQVNFLDERADIDFLGGGCIYIDENDNIIKRTGLNYYNPKYIRALYLFKNVFYNGTVMFRKRIIDMHHIRYKDNCLGMEDFRFWIECSKKGNMSNIDDILLLYRVRNDNESSRVAREHSDERKKLYAQLQRYSLRESGFCLSESMLQIINKAMAETGGKCDNLEEVACFQKALREILHQARNMNLDNYDEIFILCKRLYADKLSKLDEIWI